MGGLLRVIFIDMVFRIKRRMMKFREMEILIPQSFDKLAIGLEEDGI